MLLEDRAFGFLETGVFEFDRQDRGNGRLIRVRRAASLQPRLQQGADTGEGKKSDGGNKPSRAEKRGDPIEMHERESHKAQALAGWLLAQVRPPSAFGQLADF